MLLCGLLPYTPKILPERSLPYCLSINERRKRVSLAGELGVGVSPGSFNACSINDLTIGVANGGMAHGA